MNDSRTGQGQTNGKSRNWSCLPAIEHGNLFIRFDHANHRMLPQMGRGIAD